MVPTKNANGEWFCGACGLFLKCGGFSRSQLNDKRVVSVEAAETARAVEEIEREHLEADYGVMHADVAEWGWTVFDPAQDYDSRVLGCGHDLPQALAAYKAAKEPRP